AIPFGAGVIAGDMKSVPIQILQPTLDRNLPVRVLSEKPADDTEPDRLVRARRAWQNRRRVSRSHYPANQRPIQDLKLSIVMALIGQIERLMEADGFRKTSGSAGAFDIRRQFSQPARISV